MLIEGSSCSRYIFVGRIVRYNNNCYILQITYKLIINEYMDFLIFFVSSPTTMQKVYMARFWLPLYAAVIMSMYAYGIYHNKMH